MSGQTDTRKNDMITNMAIVTNMRFRHDKIIITNDRLMSWCSCMNATFFSDDVILSDG